MLCLTPPRPQFVKSGPCTSSKPTAAHTFFAAQNTSRALRIASVVWKASCDSRVCASSLVFHLLSVPSHHYFFTLPCRGRWRRLSRQSYTNFCQTGLLGDDDGATDLGMLERKLAEKKQASRRPSQIAQSNPTSPSQATSGHEENSSTPRSTLTSPEPPVKHEKRNSTDEQAQPQNEEVEALSEMMCSLVTNTSGETRYLGKLHQTLLLAAVANNVRVVFWVLYIFTKGYSMDQRDNRRFVFPGDDFSGVHGRS